MTVGSVVTSLCSSLLPSRWSTILPTSQPGGSLLTSLYLLTASSNSGISTALRRFAATRAPFSSFGFSDLMAARSWLLATYVAAALMALGILLLAMMRAASAWSRSLLTLLLSWLASADSICLPQRPYAFPKNSSACLPVAAMVASMALWPSAVAARICSSFVMVTASRAFCVTSLVMFFALLARELSEDVEVVMGVYCTWKACPGAIPSGTSTCSVWPSGAVIWTSAPASPSGGQTTSRTPPEEGADSRHRPSDPSAAGLGDIASAFAEAAEFVGNFGSETPILRAALVILPNMAMNCRQLAR
mmetsp:Transcript_33914/g.95326  ORF Transcript_33914/g.95326 Transcript_33914/m.95326 type:complete len:304 (-) Transcript_33914:31-942(-)